VPTPQLPLRQLRRVRWAVRATLVLGVAASVAANVLHARPDPVAQIIAAWPPLALLLTVELISRVPVHRRVLAAARLLATTAIAGIAAWVSYWHMAGVASRYGEQGASPFLLPLSVDGLVIVASVSLVELAGRIRAADAADTVDAARAATQAHDMTEDATAPAGRPDPPPLAVPGGVPVTAARPAGRDNGARPAIATAEPAGAGATQAAPAAPVGDAADPDPAASTLDTEAVGELEPVGTLAPVGEPDPVRNARPVNDGPLGPPRDRPRVAGRAVPTPPQDRPPAEPRAAVAYWHAKDPTLKPGDIAAKVGRSRSTVRRVLAELADSTTAEPGGGATGDRATRAACGVNGTANSVACSFVSR
jgi:hypothetical protein